MGANGYVYRNANGTPAGFNAVTTVTPQSHVLVDVRSWIRLDGEVLPSRFSVHRTKNKPFYDGRFRESARISMKKTRDRNRELVLTHYGGNPPKCACCGEARVEFLSVDHMNGGGSRHIRSIGGGNMFYRWLVKNGFPPGFQILCMNCNCAKGRYGRCPHEAEGKR